MDNPATQIDWVQGIIQLATAGGFGALVWYLVIKHIPAIENRHREERAEFLSAIHELTTSMREFNLMLTDLHRRMEDRKRD